MALLLYPELKQKLSGIAIMGGAIGVGNINPVAEFNILCDPEAARVVFEAGVDVDLTMVPLEVTHTVLITPKVKSEIKSRCTPEFGTCVLELLSFFKETYACCPLHFANLFAYYLFCYSLPVCITPMSTVWGA